MGPLIVHWTETAAIGIEAAAGVIIVLAVLQAFVRTIRLFLKGGVARDQEAVQIAFGRWLGMALSFELATDVLRTSVTPTWNEIGQLAAIIVLRTALNYFLRKEVETEPPPRAETLSFERARAQRPPEPQIPEVPERVRH